jgi:hypothetical protein
MDMISVLGEIKGFLEGYNNDLKYIVNVETDPNTNYAECVIHEPNKTPRIERISYEPFMYMKDFDKLGYKLHAGKSELLHESIKVKHGITITKLKTGNQKRLVDGYCYKITSKKSYNSILNYLSEGGFSPYEKLKDTEDNFVRDKKGDFVFLYRDLFFAPRLTEQFFYLDTNQII